MNIGFLSFIRLIGTAYFKKNLATVVSKLGFETPDQLFNSMQSGSNDEERNKEWYLNIKRAIRVVSEDQRPPTVTALLRHWMRSCWTKEMWINATKADQYDGLAAPETLGWLKGDNGYLFDWECSNMRKKIQATLDFLNKGCMCRTGCKTKRCSCQRSGRECGAGCECRGCVNVQFLHSPPQDLDEEEEEVEAEEEEAGSGESDDEPEELQTEIITHTFYDSDDDNIL
ncbi:hypothetical protein SPBRAN_863 [uncultured Candidatus Thioglobus sp.]|nr:hypothetical protein SPBRAN_863 [uncultured Candidatus Thioglobus sp.]